MVYREFQNIRLSALGFGTMRLPTVDGDSRHIDIPQVEKMVAQAMEQGVNYFDTAYGYHKGMSEVVMGQVLSAYPRESYFLATKFPGYDLSHMSRVREIFEEQLQKCQVEYFDFYLFHNVCEKNVDAYMDEKYGIFDYLMEQKKNGRIRHLGFSGHGSVAVLRRFLEKYGHAMEFGQLQLNWLDWEFQNAREKYALLQRYNIPVWVMEPLRGGKLCSLEAGAEETLRTILPDETVTAWAFRFLQSLDAVTMILSGMSNPEQMAQNTSTFQTHVPLSPEQRDALLAQAGKMIANTALPCTGCRYCTEKCPKNLDIPEILKLYNGQFFPGSEPRQELTLDALAEALRPTGCLGCRACEALCPQGIRISQAMSQLANTVK